MFNTHSIAGRLVISKTISFLIGLVTILILPFVQVATTLEFKLGFLLLMILMGVTIGLFGVFTTHPLFASWRLAWWVRGPLVGASYMLLLVLLAGDQLQPFMSLDIIAWTGLTSPYWAILDGIFLGGLIGYLTTRFGGEGELPVT
jgi:hypothetical protein